MSLMRMYTGVTMSLMRMYKCVRGLLFCLCACIYVYVGRLCVCGSLCHMHTQAHVRELMLVQNHGYGNVPVDYNVHKDQQNVKDKVSEFFELSAPLGALGALNFAPPLGSKASQKRSFRFWRFPPNTGKDDLSYIMCVCSCNDLCAGVDPSLPVSTA